MRNQEPTTPPPPSSLRRGSIRSAFHHQGLARLGATPFRDAVTVVGEALLFAHCRTSPRCAKLCRPFTSNKLGPEAEVQSAG